MNTVKIEIRDSTNSIYGTLDIGDHEDFPLSLDFQVKDIRSLNSGKSNFSRTFKIPATENNKDLLQHFYHANLVDSTDSRSSKQAYLYVNDMLIDIGELRPQSSLGENPTEFEVFYLGGNYNLINAIGDGYINELELGTISYDSTTIQNTWTSTQASYPVVAPLINYGQFRVNDFSIVEANELLYAAYIKSIYEQIFTDAGYVISSDFIDDGDSTIKFSKLIFPYVGDTYNLKKTEETDFRARLSAGYAASASTETKILCDVDYLTSSPNNYVFYDRGSNYNAGNGLPSGTAIGEYKIPISGYYTINGSVQVTPNPTSCFLVAIYKNGTILPDASDVETNCPSVQFTFNTNYGSIYFAEGDLISFRITDLSANPFTIDNAEFFARFDGIINWTDASKTFDVARILPFIKKIDFIKGVNHLFNFIIQTNEVSKTCYIEPRNDFYLDVSNAIDWTNRLDLSSQPEISFIDDYNQDLEIGYKQDSSDGNIAYYNSLLNINFGSTYLVLSNRFSMGNYEILNDIFSPTDDAPDASLTNYASDLYGFTIPRLHSERQDISNLYYGGLGFGELAATKAEWSTNFNYRILYYEGFITQSDFEFNFRPTPTGFQGVQLQDYNLNIYPRAFFTDFDSTTGVNLSFLTIDSSAGLYERFWKDSIEIINEGILLTAYFKLSFNDIAGLDFRYPIYLGQDNYKGYWTINKIGDYAPNKDELVKVELIKYKATNSI